MYVLYRVGGVWRERRSPICGDALPARPCDDRKPADVEEMTGRSLYATGRDGQFSHSTK